MVVLVLLLVLEHKLPVWFWDVLQRESDEAIIVYIVCCRFAFFPVASFVGFTDTKSGVCREDATTIGFVAIGRRAYCSVSSSSLSNPITMDSCQNLIAWGVLFAGSGLWLTQSTSQDAFAQKVLRPGVRRYTQRSRPCGYIAADQVGAYNEMDIHTPNMDALAKEGLCLNKAMHKHLGLALVGCLYSLLVFRLDTEHRPKQLLHRRLPLYRSIT